LTIFFSFNLKSIFLNDYQVFIKLGIITGIIILGVMIFLTGIDNFPPTTSATMIDSLKNDITNFSSKASNSVEQKIGQSINNVVDKTSDSITDEITKAGNKVTDKIFDVKDTSQKIINEEISNFNPIESIKNVFTTTIQTP